MTSVFLVWNLAALILGGRRGRALARQGVTTTGRGVLPLFAAMELLIDVPLLVIAGLFPQVASALYLVALLAALLQAGFFFLRVVGSLPTAAVD